MDRVLGTFLQHGLRSLRLTKGHQPECRRRDAERHTDNRQQEIERIERLRLGHGETLRIELYWLHATRFATRIIAESHRLARGDLIRKGERPARFQLGATKNPEVTTPSADQLPTRKLYSRLTSRP